MTRASDTDRDQVIQLLHVAYEEGRITYAEHDERTAAALRAKTFEELEDLTADLVPVAPAVPSTVDPAGASVESDRLTAMLSESKRTGPWRIRRLTHANAFAGSVLLDLTEATFEAPVVEINCSVFVGDVKIIVRPGTNVLMQASTILGDSSVKGIGVPDPAMPTVVVSGTCVVGDISVRGPKQPPFWKRHVA